MVEFQQVVVFGLVEPNQLNQALTTKFKETESDFYFCWNLLCYIVFFLFFPLTVYELFVLNSDKDGKKIEKINKMEPAKECIFWWIHHKLRHTVQKKKKTTDKTIQIRD